MAIVLEYLKKAWKWCRKWWWVLVSGAAALLFLLWRIVRNPPEPGHEKDVPKYLDRAKEQVDRVHLEAEVEKARVTASSDAKREEIDRIEEKGKEDPKEARRQMADWLSRNL